jgi:hypothetical protein
LVRSFYAVCFDVCFWHIADIRDTATIWSLLGA